MARERRSGAARAYRVVTLGAGVTGTYLRHWLRGPRERQGRDAADVHAQVARRVRQELGVLRGPVMKLGQALSLHGSMLPEEVLAELTKLHMEAPPMHPALARTQFRLSVGCDPSEAFGSFEPAPFAAASIGQVHRATSRAGESLAVKIQYPGIDAAIRQDFRLLRTASIALRLTRHVPASLLDELEEQIGRETDYAYEASNVARFASGLAPLPYFSVPRVVEEFSTARVLTMSLLPGEHLDAFLRRRPRQALRDEIGRRLFEGFYRQLFGMGLLHADPNWGNYLFRPDGTIGLVDFGCVKPFDAAFLDNLRGLFSFQGPRESPGFHRLLRERYTLGGARLTAATRRTMVQFSREFYQRVYPADGEPFDFADDAPLRAYVAHAAMLLRARGLLPEHLFLARAEIGLYNTLHRLRARVATTPIVRRAIGDPR